MHNIVITKRISCVFSAHIYIAVFFIYPVSTHQECKGFSRVLKEYKSWVSKK